MLILIEFHSRPYDFNITIYFIRYSNTSKSSILTSNTSKNNTSKNNASNSKNSGTLHFSKEYSEHLRSRIPRICAGRFEEIYRANWKNSEQYLILKSFFNIDNITNYCS
ncbi:hypothetical protein RhiirA1_463021 [Rhizophagus irregularis]|uniref:Uncharacterized protein n=1 Tax=Rhizophagus irregularis TaxID=588596 RepID=A0A2N0RL22_9GLOM|nr:hypothetical protein RhiirA1_463021 [Rhizophagus irregularis]